tara:strand:- start:114 stop:452 length:339 start_codon:yes stop_codon:yes gene_type:complete
MATKIGNEDGTIVDASDAEKEGRFDRWLLDRRSNAPIHILDSINRYVEHGIEPGGFVTAVLSNNLVATFRAADAKSLRGLSDILQYIYLEIPSACWGSEAKVKAWTKNKREK